MSNATKTNKKTVELASEKPEPGSRIRRAPVGPIADERRSLVGRIQWDSREWEIRLATAGIVFFALAITAVVIDVGYLLSN